MTIKFTRIFLLVLCTCFSFMVKAQVGNPPSSPAMSKADSFYFAQDWVNAKKAYSKILSDTSHNAIAWNRLGFSDYNTGDMAAAMKCYEKALLYQPVPPLKASVYSRMARINSLENKKEEAFANIDSAINSGYTAFNELDTLKEFNGIRNEDRFKKQRDKLYNAAYPCMANPQARAFDFWVGEWDAYPTGTKTLAGHSVIQVISGGCAILENWTSARGLYTGKSLNFIDPSTTKWRQNWVGNGDSQDFVNGEYKDGAMRFTFESKNAKGQKTIGRFIFYNEGPDKVRQFNETSADDGKTWVTSYDLTYIRVKKQS